MMNQVPQKFIDDLCESMGVGFDTTEITKQAAELRSATLGKFTKAPAAGNAKGEKVTADGETGPEGGHHQDNSQAAQSATGEGSGQDDGVEDSGGSPDGAQVDGSQGKGSPELPDITVDYKEGEQLGHGIKDHVELSDRLDVIEETLGSLCEVVKGALRGNEKPSPEKVETDKDVFLYCESTGDKYHLAEDDKFDFGLEYYDENDINLVPYYFSKNEDGSVNILGEVGKKKSKKTPDPMKAIDDENFMAMKEPGKAEASNTVNKGGIDDWKPVKISTKKK